MNKNNSGGGVKITVFFKEVYNVREIGLYIDTRMYPGCNYDIRLYYASKTQRVYQTEKY